MQNDQNEFSELELFEKRVRSVSEKGTLLPYSIASYISGLSDTRLRALVAAGKLETENIDGRIFIVLSSLINHRRRSLNRGVKIPNCETV